MIMVLQPSKRNAKEAWNIVSERPSAKDPGPVAARGFTLPELVMVLIVVAVLAVFAVPRLEFASGFGERAYHDKLKAGLQFARKAAVASRRYVCVAVTTGTGGTLSLRIENAVPENTTGGCAGVAGTDLNLPTPDSTSGCLANQICAGSLSLSADNTSFNFDAQGRLLAGSTVTFTTAHGLIKVEAETGYVH